MQCTRAFKFGCIVLLFTIIARVDAFLFSRVNENDLYGVLSVSRGASKAEIKKAFRELTRQHHPDVQETLEAKEAAKEYMVKLLRAYEVLSDDEKREAFDRSGVLLGDRLNAAEFSAEEIFAHFHQNSPILSKTRQLETEAAVRRILNFRGNRLFLVQLYDDSCKSCRWFASTWETFAKSSLAEGGIVEMHRIDALSPEGNSLISVLGARYLSEAHVVGVVDGVLWPMHQLAAAVKAKSGRAAHDAMHQFIMSFVGERRAEVHATEQDEEMNALLHWLQKPRDAHSPLRVLIPPLAAEGIPLTLSMMHDKIALVRAVPRAPLLRLVEEYCDTPIEVRDRHGELVPVPEFIVVSTLQLGNNSGASRSCRGVEVGSSSALTFRKAAAFLAEHIPPRHVGMNGMSHLSSMSFYDVCQLHCLMWIRRNCLESPTPQLLNTLQSDYKPFKVGYICLNEELVLREAMPEENRDDDGFAAIVDGIDSKPHFIYGTDHVSIAQALATLLSDGHKAAALYVPSPISKLLVSKPFPISLQQTANLYLAWLWSFIGPFWTNSYPFLMMYIAHKIMQRFNIGGMNDDSNNNNNNNQNNNEKNAKSQNARGANSASKSPPSNRRSSPSGVPTYEPSDLEKSKTERGFLLLFIPNKSASPTLPLLARSPPFTARLVPLTDTVWRPWLTKRQEQQQQEEKEQQQGTETKKGVNERASDSEEQEKPIVSEGLKAAEMTVVALRQGKMMAAVKPLEAPLESWLLDLIDGSVTANEAAPSQ